MDDKPICSICNKQEEDIGLYRKGGETAWICINCCYHHQKDKQLLFTLPADDIRESFDDCTKGEAMEKCEKCGKIRHCEEIPMMGYTVMVCKPCNGSMLNSGETV